MQDKSNAEGARRGGRLAPAGALFALAGLALFAYFVWAAGPSEVWSNISKIGWGFALILLLAGLRFGVRALAWTLCFEPPHRLGLLEAFRAYLIGDAAGNVVPFGIVVGEPAKAALASSERVPFSASFSAIAVENVFYMLSVALFIFCGAAALLAGFHLTKVLRYSSYGIIAVVFKFVPLRAGIDELGTGQLARVLAFGVTAGVTLAIVRKARMIFWMAAGVALLLGRGLSLHGVAEGAQQAQAAALGAKAPAPEEKRSLAEG